MKRTLFSFLCVVLPLFVMAQVKDYSKAKDYSHWSVSGEVGANFFDGDVRQDVWKAFNWGGLSLSPFGVAAEYALTPVWGVSLGYSYIKYQGIVTDAVYLPYLFNTNSHNVDINATINFMKLLFPESATKWHVNGSVGAGPAFYKFQSLIHEDGTALTAVELADVSLASVYGKSVFRAVNIPLSLSTEYNFSNSLALGAKLQARIYNQDDMEGVNFIQYQKVSSGAKYEYVRKPWRGSKNDMAEALSVYLRYKIDAIDKDHLRNISMKQFNENEDLKKLQAEVKDLKGKVSDVDGKVNNLIPRIEKLEKVNTTITPDGADDDVDGVPNIRDKEPATPKGNEVDFYGRTIPGLKHITEDDLGKIAPNQLVDGKDTDVDGVPDNRDKEPKTPKGNPVDFWGVTVKADQALGEGSVYFDFDKIDLDAEALKTIKLVSEKMKANPGATVEVRGYADFVGSVAYNQGLSQRRANVVKDKLVKDYGIDPSKLIANGKGKVFEPKRAYRLNRRCNFFFSK